VHRTGARAASAVSDLWRSHGRDGRHHLPLL